MTMRRLFGAALPLLLGACALSPPPARVEAPLPGAWQAPLAHNGSVADLSQWWSRQGDPLLAQLVAAAQQASPTIAAAASRLEAARAQRVGAGAALIPSVDGFASVSRASQQSTLPGGTTSQLGLQASWEIDLFGARRGERNAAQERLLGAGALWHDARVSVAAETANQYYSLRTCEQLLSVAQQDAVSRADTSRLTGLSADAGFEAPANAALARASAADASSRATQQRTLCDIDIKALVALTGTEEPALRRLLAASGAVEPAALAISALPAQVLSQRPDLYSAEREVAAASFEVGSTQAQRYPRLSLQGMVGVANFRSGGENTQLDAWTIGPLSLSVPLFDAGRRAANVDVARARYEEAVARYRAGARQAVREVEEALVRLDSTAARSSDAQAAMAGYRSAFIAAEDRYKMGMGSLLELEDARRTRLAAENAVITLQRERSAAWVALYRAAGGGWTGRAAN
ncbi:efflux transporter outer membrane subunit [Massilia cavernae]|uniref:Efflux transporter outer membrane subunit n=1 Tax=Massilia cavernae TaxID=2320864 RepID=A0A418Y6P4_9BURK|nr:efflux transporter outer membrane subunit [Massilia cavernae]RJG23933.1 efflux transporter outer membrane subunit [Massilia cavernae]